MSERKYKRLIETDIGLSMKDDFGNMKIDMDKRLYRHYKRLKDVCSVSMNASMKADENDSEYVKLRDEILTKLNVLSNTLDEKTNRRTIIVVSLYPSRPFIFEDETTGIDDIVIGFIVCMHYKEIFDYAKAVLNLNEDNEMQMLKDFREAFENKPNK